MNHTYPPLTAKNLHFCSLAYGLRDPSLGWEIGMAIKVLGIDIAKNTFQLHGVDGSGKAVLKSAYRAINWPPMLLIYLSV